MVKMEGIRLQLLYVWTKSDSMTVKGEGIHFHSELRFEYMPVQGELFVRKNPFFIERFFSENPNFDQVTAIVGRNGTGKTSLLRFIVSLLANGNEGFASMILEEPILCIFRESSGSDELIVVHNPNLKLVGGNYEEHNVSVIQPDYFKETYIVEDNEAHFNNLSIVLYSNIFDNTTNGSGSNLIDMTTNTFLSKAINTEPEAHETQLLKYVDIRRQISFFLEQRNSSYWTIPFEVPEVMYFRFLRLLHKLQDNLMVDIVNFGSGSTEEKYAFESYILKAFKELERISPIRTPLQIEEGIQYLTKLFLLLLYEQYRYSPEENTDEINRFIEEYKLEPQYHIGSSIFSNIVGLMTERLKQNEKIDKRFIEQAAILENIFDKLIDLIENDVVTLEEGAIRAPLFSHDSPAATVHSILGQGRSKVNIEFDMDWPDLSSGEKSLLTMYARLYEAFTLDTKQEHMVLMIDEGELYMHPQWQRRFIKELIDFSTEYCCVHQQKTLDIVMTTNSPFLISDLPHANIVFLQTTEIGTTVVGGLEEHRQTFAANIHTLLSDAFFLPDGLLGEFAKQKLNRLVKELYQDDIADIREKESSIRKQIEIIGEPVIRNKLISVLEDRLRIQNYSMQHLVSRISDLEAEVRSLKVRGSR